MLLLAAACTSFACATRTPGFCSDEVACDDGSQCNHSRGQCQPSQLVRDRGGFVQLLEPTRALDLLFVVDNSPNNEELQARFATALPAFQEVLDVGGRPDLHVGAITTDVGISPHATATCGATGDDGVLVTGPADCNSVDGEFLVDALISDSGRRFVNYEGTLAETLACMSRVGTGGCEFPQPLSATYEALQDEAPNPSFLRPEAFLGIVTITGKDDCSARNSEIFNPQEALDDVSSALGPFSLYRCFDFGVSCDQTLDDPVLDRQTLGPRSGCAPREPSPYLRSVDEHVRFLKERKGGRPLVWSTHVSGGGNQGRVNVVEVDGTSVLDSVCQLAGGEALPATRLAVIPEFFGLPIAGDVCTESLESEVVEVAETFKALLSGQCLAALPRELSEADGTSGLDCDVYDVAGGGAGLIVGSFDLCGDNDSQPCFAITEDAAACPFGPGLRVELDRKGVPAAPLSVPVLRCTAR